MGFFIPTMCSRNWLRNGSKVCNRLRKIVVTGYEMAGKFAISYEMFYKFVTGYETERMFVTGYVTFFLIDTHHFSNLKFQVSLVGASNR